MLAELIHEFCNNLDCHEIERFFIDFESKLIQPKWYKTLNFALLKTENCIKAYGFALNCHKNVCKFEFLL